jgi:hypothetical protein
MFQSGCQRNDTSIGGSKTQSFWPWLEGQSEWFLYILDEQYPLVIKHRPWKTNENDPYNGFLNRGTSKWLVYNGKSY